MGGMGRGKPEYKGPYICRLAVGWERQKEAGKWGEAIRAFRKGKEERVCVGG